MMTTTKATSRARAIIALSLLAFFVIFTSSYRDSRILSPTTSSSSSVNEREDAALREAFNSYRLNAPLFEAVKSGDVDLVRAMLKDGISGSYRGGDERVSFYNVNAEDVNGITPLIEASLLGDVKLVNMLLSAGARAQPLPGYRHTPLRAACLTGNAQLIKLLLEEGADPNSRSEGGRTPLMGACYLRPQYDEGPDRNELSYRAVNLLLSDPRTDPTVENDFGESALDLCRERMYNKSMAILRERISGGKKFWKKAKGGKLLKNAVGKLRGKKKKKGKK
jgi:ankyrin repeat protein